jgi:putative acetyltransferase
VDWKKEDVNMNIRQATDADVPALADLYRQTVIVNGPAYYTPEQTEVWAAFASNTRRFSRFILDVTTFVAENDSGIVGFAGIGNDGHVASTYIRHDCLHQGIGSRLMQHLLDYAETHNIQRLFAEANPYSVGLFQKFGFQTYDTEIVDRNGVTFERYLVERHCQWR